MQFKHPELLYLLFLLVIPVLVHLFQLRRFRTELFTNVKFLKKAVLQTRKSSRIKKWLILFTRLFLLACIIIAFAQPYFPSENENYSTEQTIIYLDNSYSMQAKGKNGILLKRAVQELLESLPEEGRVTLFTNDSDFKNIKTASLRKKLQELDYSQSQLDWKTVFLKAASLKNETANSKNNFILISDFQSSEDQVLPENENMDTYLVHIEPEELSNVSIDSAFITSKNVDQTEIAINLKSYGPSKSEVPVALYNGNNLLAKKSIRLEEEQAQTSFTLNSAPFEKGRVVIEDNGLQFDNELFFSINAVDPVKVVVIGNADASFLERIFTAPEFDLNIFTEDKVDFNKLSSASLVILNEPGNISGPLSAELNRLRKENTFLIFIPSEEANLSNYNPFFRSLGLPDFNDYFRQEKLISGIVYEHPVYASVFEEKVSNFQYPKVNGYFRIKGSGNAVLRYENKDPFLLEKGNIFVFTAPLNRENSNFQGAPLIVPTFYNIGNMAISPETLYSVLGQSNKISLQANLRQDEILKLTSGDAAFIPRQQSFSNKMDLYLEEVPEKEGHYEIKRDTFKLKSLSFNLERSESDLRYMDPEAFNGVSVHSKIPDVFEEIQTAGKVDVLWKWFVIFAIVFLLIEMLILKYFK